MYHPLGIKLALVGQFRQIIEGLMKMFVTQPDFHWPTQKRSGPFAVATTSVLARFIYRGFHLRLVSLSLLQANYTHSI